METKKYETFFCKRYGDMADVLCPKINSDDWDELEDCCSTCGGKSVITTEVEVFKAECIEDTAYVKKGEIVEAYALTDEHLVVNGLITHIKEFREHFKVS